MSKPIANLLLGIEKPALFTLRSFSEGGSALVLFTLIVLSVIEASELAVSAIEPVGRFIPPKSGSAGRRGSLTKPNQLSRLKKDWR
ncbi:hypothetical protein A3A66_03175 [Microgenomates group bacterium RIFCSPLOWO2_01_FULL_46_13]|nr:MAG: hypothetical protein A2783_04830 [Microgenomates group bacterium RIFCSPHIGHO2_01_FULL_45_11]OGV94154.1 MAG: hypothetical protein A3A66_03175 [Microgenomates group bacterium RIFCSPLOWO2_01_FULL_46_13]